MSTYVFKYKEDILDFVKFSVVALLVVLLFRSFVMEPYQISGKSMAPLFNGIGEERVAVWKLARLHRGDIVVAKPKNQKQKIIKRVVGIPGDRIQIRTGKVYINDEELKESYLAPKTYTSSPTSNIITLEEDQYFLMGDNRPSSQDSRQIGPVKKSEMIGRVLFQYYPPSDFQFFFRDNK